MTLLDTQTTDFIGLLGVAIALVGIVLLLRPPGRNERARQRQSAWGRYDPLLANEQLDEQTQFHVDRYQNQTLGILLIGMGVGFIIGVAGQMLFLYAVPGAQTQTETAQALLMGCIQVGALFAITLIYLIAALCRRTRPNATLPSAFIRPNTYRLPWILLAGAVTFALITLISITKATSIYTPGSNAQTSGQMALLVLWPVITGIIVFAPEGLLRLVGRHPLWPPDLDPILALKAQGVAFRALAGVFWGVLPCLALSRLAFEAVFGFLSGSAVYSILAGALLALCGIFWLFVMIFQFIYTLIFSVIRQRDAITQLTGNTQPQPTI